jgi:hypothetical protein
MISEKTYVINSPDDLSEWYDESTTDERERELKPILTSNELQDWFSDMSGKSRLAAFQHLKGRTLTIDLS